MICDTVCLPEREKWWLTFPTKMRRSRWCPPIWDHSCPYCNAALLTGEGNDLCCNTGKHVVPRLPPLSTNICNITLQQNASSLSCSLNNLFSFTAIGATGGFEH